MITLLDTPIQIPLGFTDRYIFLSGRRCVRRRHNLVYTCSSGSCLVSSSRIARLHCIYCTRPRLHLNTIKHNIIKSPTAIPTWVFSKIETTPSPSDGAHLSSPIIRSVLSKGIST